MEASSADPFEQAMLDYAAGQTDATIVVRYTNGDIQTVPMQHFFRAGEDLPPQETLALNLCRGTVLDIGAGSGCHGLILQSQNVPVWGLDRSPACAEIMRRLGLEKVIEADVFAYQDQRFDTLLLLMNSIGLVQTLAGLDRFLHHAHSLLAPSGQILLDSADLNFIEDEDLAEDPARFQGEPYFGEIGYTVEYQGQVGSLVPWLYVDPETLTHYALQAGWFCQIVFQDEDGSYLARLTPV